MSLQPPGPDDNGLNDIGTNQVEGLKVWSCVNCRRRKVRCDRRHPCDSCTRNQTECIFPISGRIPRRSRDVNYPKPPAQRQGELLGRLRRLEAMVGDLSSQVEQAAVASQGTPPVESSASSKIATSAMSSERDWPEHQVALRSQLAGGISRSIHDGIQSGSGMGDGASEELQVSTEPGELMVASNGDLVIGDRFWTVFCKEVEHIFEAIHGPAATHLDGDSSSSTISTSGNRSHSGYYNFLLSNTHQREDLHPLPSQMLFLWQIYVDNVDPFMKVLHVPTMTKVIRELRGSYRSLSSGMQTLVLVISLAAIMSLEDEEVYPNFNTTKEQLVARYRLGTEQALSQADFLNNPDIVVIQALTIYLAVLQHTGEMRPAWFLAGILVRVSVFMKLHRDGSHFAEFNPFEVEMQRRLWWHICLIDSRSEDMHVSEYKLLEGMFDTEMPANVDDANLDLGMSELPAVSKRWTDMTVFLIRCEIWVLSRRLQSATVASGALPSGIDERLQIFHHSQARIEDTYLKHLNPNQPLHSFIATAVRLFLTRVNLILHTKQHSGRAAETQPTNASQSDKVFTSSLSIIEYTYSLQNEPSWSGWRWQIQGRQPPWHALRIVLGHLCTQRWGLICEQAWPSAKNSFDSLPEGARTDPRYQQLSLLVSAVQRNRAHQPHQQTSGAPTSAPVDLASAAASYLSAPLAQVAYGGTLSTWIPQEPLVALAEDSNNALDDALGLEMDWQVWDDVAGELEPPLEFWDIAGL